MGFDPVVAAADGSSRSPVIPFPFDALFAGAKTPTLAIPNGSNNPLITQANLQDGFSTTASMFIDVFGYVDMATVASDMTNPLANNLIILNRSTGAPLFYGTDLTIESSTVKDGSGVPISAQRTRLLIEPLKPLAPNTTYVILLKKGIKTLNGGMVQPSFMFSALNSDTPVASRTDSYFTRFNATEKATLEALRDLVRNKIVNTLKTIPVLGVTDTNVLLAYSVTTQSTTKTMEKLAAAVMPSEIAAAPIGQTVKQVLESIGQVAPPNADQTNVYVGTLKVPYYGDVATAENQTAIYSSYWKADAAMPDIDAGFLGTPKACGAYAAGLTVNGIKLEPSVSTTTCFPMPIHKVENDQTIPMVVTVPNRAAPEAGWPVVIFQHGITRNRTDIFAVASTFAAAGFVTVAIDLPMHGLPSSNKLYKNKLLANTEVAGLMTNNERTFDVDIFPVTVDATGKFVGKQDNVIDDSGTHFINLLNPITTRDNLRQGASDILVLAKSLSNLKLTNLSGQPIKVNGSQVRYASISLGSIVGTVALGADKSASLIGAASLSVGSGGLPKLLDGSKSYGPIITAGLAGSGVLEGSDGFESFMRLAQTLTDSGDPINFAMNARYKKPDNTYNRPVHFTQVLNDLVVSNASVKGSTSATQDFVGATGFLSGNNALAKIMGFTEKKEIDINNFNKENLTTSAWLQFTPGEHGSYIDPRAPEDKDSDAATVASDAKKAAYAAVTTEMQCQAANFFATNGTFLPVGCSKPAAVVEAVQAVQIN